MSRAGGGGSRHVPGLNCWLRLVAEDVLGSLGMLKCMPLLTIGRLPVEKDEGSVCAVDARRKGKALAPEAPPMGRPAPPKAAAGSVGGATGPLLGRKTVNAVNAERSLWRSILRDCAARVVSESATVLAVPFDTLGAGCGELRLWLPEPDPECCCLSALLAL